MGLGGDPCRGALLNPREMKSDSIRRDRNSRLCPRSLSNCHQRVNRDSIMCDALDTGRVDNDAHGVGGGRAELSRRISPN